MNECGVAPPAIGPKRRAAAARPAGRFGSVAARAHVATWSVLGAAVLWGTTGTAATFAPRGTSSLAIGAAAMGIGAIALFMGACRAAIRLITTGLGGRALWLGTGLVVAYPLAFYFAMADAGVAIGVTMRVLLSTGVPRRVLAILQRRSLRICQRWC
jgi:DME family drug/metabolite transporter